MNDTRYDDIMYLPRPVSAREPMARESRAAQFAPFAALHGHEEAIDETARLTDRRAELEEEQKERINACLQQLAAASHPTVAVTYFIPDERKDGGRYTTVCDTVKRVDEWRGCLTLDNNGDIPFSCLYTIEMLRDKTDT